MTLGSGVSIFQVLTPKTYGLFVRHIIDEELVKHFGENWEQETYRGFQTIIDFKLWLQDRRYKGNVS